MGVAWNYLECNAKAWTATPRFCLNVACQYDGLAVAEKCPGLPHGEDDQEMTAGLGARRGSTAFKAHIVKTMAPQTPH